MALKDLVAKTAALAEGAIEEIVGDYIRYDPQEGAIHFMPAAAGLSNRAKVLVYLVALQGWPYVTDESMPTDAKPAEIEKNVDILGGTLRPILKELRDRHVIVERSGRYSVRTATLATIKAELGERSAGTTVVRKKPKRSARSKSQKNDHEQTDNEPKTQKGRSKKSGNLAALFEKWIDDGFFDTPKTLADVQKRFHKQGAIIPQSSIPGYLLKAIRNERLIRDEAEVGGKRVWVYSRKA